MLRTEEIEKMKRDLFEYVITYFECPSPKDYYPYKRRIAAIYSLLLREKNKVLREKCDDKYSLIKFFKEIDKIISLNEESKKLYLKINRKELSKEEIIELIELTKKENKNIMSRIRRRTKISDDNVNSLKKKNDEIKVLNAMKKLNERKITNLENALKKEKSIVKN